MGEYPYGHITIKSVEWLRPILKPGGLAEIVKKVETVLQSIEFDAIAFTGLSGAVLSSIIAMRMNKLLYCVRKEHESRHSGQVVEGPSTGLRYVIIDDLICTGTTIRRIIKLVSEHTIDTAQLVAIYLYRDEKLITHSDLKIYTTPNTQVALML